MNENARPTLKGQKVTEKKEVKSTLSGVVATPCGNSIAPVYKRVYDKELDRNIVKKVDTMNITEFIQASKAQTDLAILQKRFLELGEIPNVNPDMGSHDLANMPSDIHGLYAMANDVAGNFARLPKSIQDIFGSKEAYLKAILDGSYQATLINAINSSKAQESPKQEDKKQEEGK